MEKAILVPTIRADFMKTFMSSLHFLPKEWGLYIVFQEYTRVQVQEILTGPGSERIRGYMEIDRTPPYIARGLALDLWYDDVDVWVNCDDDMEMLKAVDFDSMARMALTPGVGAISGAWAKSPGHLHRVGYEDTFCTQPLVNMAGGMCYSRKIAREILQAPIKAYMFCDVQAALVAYVAGFTNHRYFGSVIIHRIMSKGGLRQSYALRTFELPPPEYLVAVEFDGPNQMQNNYFMPGEKQLTEFAHAEHRRNREAALLKVDRP